MGRRWCGQKSMRKIEIKSLNGNRVGLHFHHQIAFVISINLFIIYCAISKWNAIYWDWFIAQFFFIHSLTLAAIHLSSGRNHSLYKQNDRLKCFNFQFISIFYLPIQFSPTFFSFAYFFSSSIVCLPIETNTAFFEYLVRSVVNRKRNKKYATMPLPYLKKTSISKWNIGSPHLVSFFSIPLVYQVWGLQIIALQSRVDP